MLNKIGGSFYLANIPNGSLITVTIAGITHFSYFAIPFLFLYFLRINVV